MSGAELDLRSACCCGDGTGDTDHVNWRSPVRFAAVSQLTARVASPASRGAAGQYGAGVIAPGAQRNGSAQVDNRADVRRTAANIAKARLTGGIAPPAFHLATRK